MSRQHACPAHTMRSPPLISIAAPVIYGYAVPTQERHNFGDFAVVQAGRPEMTLQTPIAPSLNTRVEPLGYRTIPGKRHLL